MPLQAQGESTSGDADGVAGDPNKVAGT